jgi:hypothetical protein
MRATAPPLRARTNSRRRTTSLGCLAFLGRLATGRCGTNAAGLVDVGRDRSTDIDHTVRKYVDVGEAFGEETPTSPSVPGLVPLDAVPALAVPRAGLPWDDLGKLATQLLLRIDGMKTAMSVVHVDMATPTEAARELARLTAAGLVRLVVPVAPEVQPLELDLSLV